MGPSLMLMGASACCVLLAIIQLHQRHTLDKGNPYRPSLLSIGMTWVSAVILPFLMVWLKQHGAS